VGARLPLALQTGQVLLAHLSTPAQLSQYALMAQLYAARWQVVSTAPLAYWPIFVQGRGAATLHSGGQFDVSACLALAFSALLIGQATPLPGQISCRPGPVRPVGKHCGRGDGHSQQCGGNTVRRGGVSCARRIRSDPGEGKEDRPPVPSHEPVEWTAAASSAGQQPGCSTARR
jgi:hypothetical protein